MKLLFIVAWWGWSKLWYLPLGWKLRGLILIKSLELSCCCIPLGWLLEILHCINLLIWDFLPYGWMMGSCLPQGWKLRCYTWTACIVDRTMLQ